MVILQRCSVNAERMYHFIVGGMFNGGSMVLYFLYTVGGLTYYGGRIFLFLFTECRPPVQRRENGHVTDVASLMEKAGWTLCLRR